MNSSRLPGKVMMEVNGLPVITFLLNRLNLSKKIDRIVIATSNNSLDNLLFNYVKSLGFDCYRGDENNVLLRYKDCAKKYNASSVVRITGDCPLIDPKIVDLVINEFDKSDVDYCSNISPPSYPDGLDVEVFKSSVLAI